MSIIINNIELPKSCFDCPCHDGEWGRCNIIKNYIGLNDNRPQYCPLKEFKPATDVAPIIHAHWIKVEKYPPFYKCSNCNVWVKPQSFFIQIFSYCPNCGAKMDEEVNKND